MDLSFIANNLLSPPILFFALGLVAVLLRSDLELPGSLPKVLSLYLLFAIGFKGGVALRQVPLEQAGYVAAVLGAAMTMASIVPLAAFFALKSRLAAADAAAMAAAYGSISAVTFITAIAFLDKLDLPYGGYMVAAMALMESPAIVVGVLLYRRYSTGSAAAGKASMGSLLHEAFLNGPVFLLLGSLAVGAISTNDKAEALRPFVGELFDVLLVIFLLDMGIVAGRRMGEIRRAGAYLIGFGLVTPLVAAAVALGAARLVGMTPADGLLFVVLCASASYIAVPAACRIAIPEANPSLYVTMSLAVTFPFNITVGIPLYWAGVRWALA